MEVDPDTLATRGEFDFGGQLKSVSLTAHPKLDLHRNELIAFSYQAQGDATPRPGHLHRRCRRPHCA